MKSNRIISMRYDIAEDLMRVAREDGSQDVHPYTDRLATLARAYEEWAERANGITPHEVRYAFWLGADA